MISLHWLTNTDNQAPIFAPMSKSMMDLVAEFPAQMKEALEIANRFELKNFRDFENVLICGLGGSGIGGTILSQLIADESNVPVVCSKDYTIPSFVTNKTLVIACSYSGNTEETLESLEFAIENKAQIASITSGGKLLEMARQHGWPCIQIPSGYPPRAAFGFSITQLFKMAEAFGLITSDWNAQFVTAANYIETHQERISDAGRQLAEAMKTKLPVIYTSTWLEGVGTRWRQQINENAKMLCWHHYYPEMNHNELVGWRNENHQLGVIFLTSDLDHPRVVRRMELSEEVYRKYTPHIHHCAAEGESAIEQAIFLIHLGDWMSVHLAALRNVDSTEVKIIDWLKGELAKF
ncbi:MAG: bifunctional phosphoglucose/phosphomannose isomerase [Flavobacteriales bacterium]